MSAWLALGGLAFCILGCSSAIAREPILTALSWGSSLALFVLSVGYFAAGRT